MQTRQRSIFTKRRRLQRLSSQLQNRRLLQNLSQAPNKNPIQSWPRNLIPIQNRKLTPPPSNTKRQRKPPRLKKKLQHRSTIFEESTQVNDSTSSTAPGQADDEEEEEPSPHSDRLLTALLRERQAPNPNALLPSRHSADHNILHEEAQTPGMGEVLAASTYTNEERPRFSVPLVQVSDGPAKEKRQRKIRKWTIGIIAFLVLDAAVVVFRKELVALWYQWNTPNAEQPAASAADHPAAQSLDRKLLRPERRLPQTHESLQEKFRSMRQPRPRSQRPRTSPLPRIPKPRRQRPHNLHLLLADAGGQGACCRPCHG